MTREYQRPGAPPEGLRLHLNENTAGCSPAVVAAIASLSARQMAVYPDYDAVYAATAARLGVTVDRLILTNGLDDGILAASIAALRHSPETAPYEAIVVVPAFDMYATCAEAVGGRVVEVPLGEAFAFPLDAVRRAVTPRTRILFLTNPNNPTGTLVSREDILTLARELPHVLVFVDEAYADFAGVTLLGDNETARFQNLIVGRTFAKSYGLAGIRAGAVIGDAAALAPMRRIVPPYTLNLCAAAALPAALADVAHHEWYLAQVRESKQLLYAALDRLGVEDRPSAANFVLARFGDRLAEVVAGLAARQVIVRDRSKDPGCAGCARITTGVVDHTKTCIQALEEVLCAKAS